jgi:hypothetical protein
MPSHEPLAFVSYRRTDSSAASRWLANSIGRTFGSQSVFIDTESIRMSDDWAHRITDALAAATVLIPVIGPRWLSSTHERCSPKDLRPATPPAMGECLANRLCLAVYVGYRSQAIRA